MKSNLLLFGLLTILLPTYAQLPESLPAILVTRSGNKIASKNEWESIRRSEILDLFQEEVYGTFPNDFSPEVRFIVNDEDRIALDGIAIRKQISIQISYDNDNHLQADLLIYLPKETRVPVPVFLGLNFNGNHTIHKDSSIFITKNWVRNNNSMQIYDNKANIHSRGVASSRWPIEYILSRGYGVATMYCGDFDPDFDDHFTNGLHALMNINGANYPLNGAGTISAWSFGLSKAMDYLQGDPDIAHNQVIVIGHSRLGKTALWAGALDQRFAMVISNNSGCGGAALSMRKEGETVKAINDKFPHWFCGNFKHYNNNEESLPVDQHMLLSLVAPRPLYVASAEEDAWADPYGEQLSAWLATEVYSLYNLETKLEMQAVKVNAPVKSGYLGYHIRSGKHDITVYDWEQYLDFADYHFNRH